MFRLLFSTITIFCLLLQTYCHDTSCPTEDDWLYFNNKCYKFTASPCLAQQDASTHCQRHGATLLSVNTPEEHDFINGWLQSNDQRRGSWLTSGITSPAGVIWLGDGTSANLLDKWIPNIGPSHLLEGYKVIYNYTGAEYGWNTALESDQSSFVCEISVNEVYRILQQQRDFDYGLNINNSDLAPKGPTFLLEPQNTVVVQTNAPTVTLDCLAQGNPQPTYEWLKLNESSFMDTILPDNRYTFSTGQLEIRNPVFSDESTYQCKAINDYGVILSSSAALSFGYLGEFSNVNPAPVSGITNDGAQLECPYIVGKPVKSYQWYKNDNTSLINNSQTHTFISSNGKLYFSELAPSDAGDYYCLVTFSVFDPSKNYIGVSRLESRMSRPIKLNVRSGMTSPFPPIILNDFLFIFPPTPTKGTTVRLECIAYGTGPLIYSWSRDGGKSLPNNSTFESNGRLLILQNVELVDGGRYTCKVHSTTTNLDDSRSIDVTIQAKPYFTYPLTHQHTDSGSQLTWHCEAEGRPTPNYQWYKNGEVLKSSQGITINVNTLTIENVQAKRDNGMYQCAAINLHGMTFSTAQLRVLELAPSFEKNAMVKVLAGAVNGSVTILCNAVAAPPPTYTWLKDNSSLNLVHGACGDHFCLLKNGSLVIRGIQQGDRGKYTCQVENKFGKAEDNANLEVYDPFHSPINDGGIVTLCYTLFLVMCIFASKTFLGF